jgi:pentatricopeptide repeat protein
MGFDDVDDDNDDCDDDAFVKSALVDMYAKCGSLADARYVLDTVNARSLVSWNALIGGLAEHGSHGKEALECLEEMQSEGTFPDAITYVCSLRACARLVESGRKLHGEIAKDGLEADRYVGIALIDMYAKCGFLEEAREAFDELPSRDVVPWNALISGYVEHGLAQEAMACVQEMDDDDILLDAITTTCSFRACIITGAIERGRWIHSASIKRGLTDADPTVESASMEMYAKCGCIEEARAVFESAQDRSEVSWSALLWGYACRGESEPVFGLHEQMLGQGMFPDSVSWLSLLTACSHDGLVGEDLLRTISSADSFSPTLEHCNCIVDLYCRSGQLLLAMSVVEMMPFQPNSVTWCTVAGLLLQEEEEW